MSGRKPVDAREVLARAAIALQDAKQALDDYTGTDLNRKATGFRNLTVWTRAIPHILEGLRKIDAGRFDAWFAPYKADWTNEPLIGYFRDLRNDLLKEGRPPIGSPVVIINHASTGDMVRQLGSRPDGATGVFVGDELGGIGWEIELPDGTIERLYVTVPEADIHARVGVIDYPPPPNTFQGRDVKSLEEALRLYIEYMGGMIASARSAFMP
jgi:hypothetical protein